MSQIHRWPALLGGVFGLILMAGCGESLPTAHPVQGKVVLKGGNVASLVGGMVRLQSVSDPTLMAVGEIEDGGIFSAGAFYKDKSLQGVPAGEYKVRIEPPNDDDDDEDRPFRAVIEPRYRDFDKSRLRITVPVTGEVVLAVERPRR